MTGMLTAGGIFGSLEGSRPGTPTLLAAHMPLADHRSIEAGQLEVVGWGRWPFPPPVALLGRSWVPSELAQGPVMRASDNVVELVQMSFSFSFPASGRGGPFSTSDRKAVASIKVTAA
jgi:hypothetical protein